MRRYAFNGTGDFLGDIEDGLDSSGHETPPVPSVVLIAQPYAGNDLYRTVQVRYGTQVIAIDVLVFAMQKSGRASVGQGDD